VIHEADGASGAGGRSPLAVSGTGTRAAVRAVGAGPVPAEAALPGVAFYAGVGEGGQKLGNTLDDGLYVSTNACLANAMANTVTWTRLTNGMPAQDIIPGWEAQDRLIRQLGIFDDRIYMRDVVRPVLQAMAIRPDELREARRRLEAA